MDLNSVLVCRITAGLVILTPKGKAEPRTRLVWDWAAGPNVTDGGPIVTGEKFRSALAGFP
ncbi:MAG TPA: hypothetical protein VGA56_01200 [Opitutaceae bacterium]